MTSLERVGPYRLRRCIGAGGVGAVYEAVRDSAHGEQSPGARVALKVLGDAHLGVPAIAARMEREARAIAAIKSPHVVTIFDFGRDRGRPYLAMELLEGRDLGAVLAEQKTLPVARVVRIGMELLRGLVDAHAAGVLHRDLKPENVFLVGEGTPAERVKLVDFGMSKLDMESDPALGLTARGTVIGTPAYVSPEQARADERIDARADVWAAGALLFECLAGRPPHVGETYEQLLLAVGTNDAPPVCSLRPDVPGGLAEIVDRALARDREDRFASASEMREELALLAKGSPHRKTWLVPALGVLAALVGAALTLWWLAR